MANASSPHLLLVAAFSMVSWLATLEPLGLISAWLGQCAFGHIIVFAKLMSSLVVACWSFLLVYGRLATLQQAVLKDIGASKMRWLLTRSCLIFILLGASLIVFGQPKQETDNYTFAVVGCTTWILLIAGVLMTVIPLRAFLRLLRLCQERNIGAQKLYTYSVLGGASVI